jgi:alkanesulfonate monooxygenase SsuD/methylene tetrahydromethanopterin reductase-like flavin-dependent oxidoreductase (luciferase family)
VTLGTAVLVLPYHHPLRLARTLTTLAVAAPGRLAVGVGAGWLAEEFAALGAPFEARGLVTDEALHVIRTVWRDERASFCGQVFRFEDVVFAPRPAPAPPLLVGGNTARARRRALELGDGWLPIWHAPTGRGFTPEGLAAEVTALRERRPALAVAALMPLAIVEGRQAPARPEPLVGSRAALVDMLGRYREAGLDHVILSPYYGLPAEALPQTLDAVHDVLAVFVRDVRPKA